MSQMREFYYASADGKNDIHAVEWLPDGDIRAVIQIAHGIAEYIGRYDNFARYLAKFGFLVEGNDHLGHGGSYTSDDDKGFFAEKHGWDTAVSDMHTLYEITRAYHPKIPYFLLGHSMGSFLSRTYITKYSSELSGCILSGTGEQPAAACCLGSLLANIESLFFGNRGKSNRINNLCFGAYNKRINPTVTPNDWISRDGELVAKYIRDVNCGFIPTNRLVADMLGGLRFIGRKSSVDAVRKDLPIYFFSGGEDPVGGYGRGITHVYSRFYKAGFEDVSIKLYPGGRHEMLNETNKDEVYADVLEWLTKRI
ncbi:MAG: alpha/beta fold hydrolase [Oscillospiraceae bacterium]